MGMFMFRVSLFHLSVLFILSLYTQNTLAFDGFLEPIESVEISTPEMGVIIKSFAQEGKTIKKNATLIELDSSVLRASLTGLRADYQAKKRKQVELESLYKQAIASADELETAKTQTAMALSQYQTLQRQIDRRLIKSPINGVITEVTRDIGELVSQTQGPFIKIVNISTLKLIVYIPYEKVINLQSKQNVPVKISGVTDIQTGEVRYVSPVVDPASSTVKVELVVDNKDNKLRSGLPASIKLSD